MLFDVIVYVKIYLQCCCHTTVPGSEAAAGCYSRTQLGSSRPSRVSVPNSAINYVFLKTRLIPCKLCHVHGLISSLISLPWMVMKLGVIMFYNGYAMEKMNWIFTSGYANYAMASYNDF